MIIRPDGESVGETMNEPQKFGLSTGFDKLDKTILGLRPSHLITVAGVSGIGKSSLMAGLALAGAKQVPVAMFSLEMGTKMMYDRLVCNFADINYHSMVSGELSPQDLKDFNKAVKAVEKLNDIVIDHESDTMYPSWIRKKADVPDNSLEIALEKYYNDYGCRLFFIDYVQYVNYGFKIESETLRVKALTGTLHKLCLQLDVPIVIFAQLKKDVGDEKHVNNNRPTMTDIRDSGFIINDSDIILLLHRPEYFESKLDEVDLFQQRSEEAEIIVAKNRNGMTGSVSCKFHGYSMKFVDENYDFHNDLGV